MSSGVGSVLDEVAALGRRDPAGMLRLVAQFPTQMEWAWQASRSLSLSDAHRAARAVAVLGMGGSAAAGDIVRGAFGDRLTAPLVSVRDYELPAWVGRETLVIAVSHSGATEETITALGTALERRCPVVILTTGGPLADVAARVDLPRLIYPGDTPPRAALGYTLVLLAGVLERSGMLALDETEVRAAADAARTVNTTSGPDAPTDSNLAKQLAWTLVDRLPIIEGAGFLAPVARRWKTQVNENAKSTAVAEELPEATHNTVVGYEQPDTLHDHLYVIFLAAPSDYPANSRRAALSAELLAAAGISHQVLSLGGEGRLAQACSGIALGDYVASYLALLYGVDPTPVEAIAHVKAGMAGDDLAGDE
ncbi:MAG TPA: bifunctional phosphoglucose/phosphomannose isomerase [Candidatus Caenarcaniphilales bacterium]|nr:bifunctional phosphoglucose/phosphomannose isomerase [Candidatus Caenarcaniphilales bacterium]